MRDTLELGQSWSCLAAEHKAIAGSGPVANKEVLLLLLLGKRLF